MDVQLRLLHRRAEATNDPHDIWRYARELERLAGISMPEKPEPFKLFLLSEQGEGHQDRRPEAIFTSKQAARDYLQGYGAYYFGCDEQEIVVAEFPYPGDGDHGDHVEFWTIETSPFAVPTLAGRGPWGSEGLSHILNSFNLDPSPPRKAG